MKLLRFAGALTAFALLHGTAANAYTLSQAGTPSPRPPASYRGDVFVDSRGCAYVRASIGNVVNWVPRISSDKKSVVCGLTPTNLAAAAMPIPAPPAPPPPEQMTAGLTAPQAGTSAGSDTETASSIMAAANTGPAAAAPANQPASDPVAPTPVRADVVRTIEVTCPADGSAARVRVGADTVSMSCQPGQTGPVRYLVHHANGETSRVIASPAPAPAPAPVQAPQVTIVQATTPAPTAPATGSSSFPASTARVRYGGVPTGQAGNGFGHGFGTGSGAAPLDPMPSAGLASTGAPTYPIGNGYGLTDYPGAIDPVPTIPAGYRAAWTDDRLNPNRGPRSAAGNQQMAAVWDTSQVPMRRVVPTSANRGGVVMSSMNAPAARAAGATASSRPAAQAVHGYRYVQVGVFKVASNASAAAAQLRAQGLAGKVAQTRSGLNLVVAGPYDDPAALQNALAIARRGFSDAYLRN